MLLSYKFTFIYFLYLNNLSKNNKIKYRYNSNPIFIDNDDNHLQGYHPKVISFSKSFNGYKYWMAFTPYPKADATKENPCIIVSNDLIHWITPQGMINPLDAPIISNSLSYNSDTHLLFNEDTQNLEIFWRYVNLSENKAIIYFKKSQNGIIWSEKKIFLITKNRKKHDYLSPAIIYEKGVYKIWYISHRKIYYMEKRDKEITFAKILKVNYKGNYHSWHLDLIYNKQKKLYELVTCAYIKKRKTMPLFYSSSKDNISWSKFILILNPAIGTSKFDSQGLYRSSLLFLKGTYYLFYSAHDRYYNVGIGIMFGRNINYLKPYI
jgi:hypothetical protein